MQAVVVVVVVVVAVVVVVVGIVVVHMGHEEHFFQEHFTPHGCSFPAHQDAHPGTIGCRRVKVIVMGKYVVKAFRGI